MAALVGEWMRLGSKHDVESRSQTWNGSINIYISTSVKILKIYMELLGLWATSLRKGRQTAASTYKHRNGRGQHRPGTNTPRQAQVTIPEQGL